MAHRPVSRVMRWQHGAEAPRPGHGQLWLSAACSHCNCHQRCCHRYAISCRLPATINRARRRLLGSRPASAGTGSARGTASALLRRNQCCLVGSHCQCQGLILVQVALEGQHSEGSGASWLLGAFTRPPQNFHMSTCWAELKLKR